MTISERAGGTLSLAAEPLTKADILAQLQDGTLSIDKASALLDAAEQRSGGLYCKVAPKGGISVYGLQRAPTTLYIEQWERLLKFGGEILKFAKQHDAELKRKER